MSLEQIEAEAKLKAEQSQKKMMEAMIANIKVMRQGGISYESIQELLELSMMLCLELDKENFWENSRARKETEIVASSLKWSTP